MGVLDWYLGGMLERCRGEVKGVEGEWEGSVIGRGGVE